MEMVYQANIWQHSGEDWDDVAVNVSTSQPDRSGNVPTMRPVFLQPNQYIRYSRMKTKASVSIEQEVYELSPFSVDEAGADGFVADRQSRTIQILRNGQSEFHFLNI